MWIASPTRARKMDANRPASVPVTLTAPSVPRGTIDRVVTKYVVLPKALPISLEIVSLSLVQKLARKPSCHRNWHSGPPTPAIVATAHTVPAMPDPHTLEGPRLPPLFSAVPSSCFVLIFTLVAPVPWKKRAHTQQAAHSDDGWINQGFCDKRIPYQLLQG
jgi:hypothetical protein